VKCIALIVGAPSNVFGGTTPKPDEPDLESFHAMIGQLTLEHDC